MNLFHLIRVCALCTVMFVIAENARVSMMGPKLVRDVRFSNFSMSFVNKSVGTVLDCGIRSLRNKHILYLHVKLYKQLTDFQGLMIVYKCKDYYVDCENVISYNITDGCSKLNIFLLYLSAENQYTNMKNCPLHGDYYYNNFTLNVDQFGAMFSYPFEKWWERYWKFKMYLYEGGKNQQKFATALSEFYFLTIRTQHH